MMALEKGFTPDQIKDAERLCQLMQEVPDTKRRMFSVSVLAYINGLETGIVLGRDAKRRMFSVSVFAYMNGLETGIALGRDAQA